MSFYQKTIEINEELIGFVKGFINIDKNSDVFINFFQSQGFSAEQIIFIQSKIMADNVSILDRIEINPDYRKKGSGNQLFIDFRKNAHGCIILLCDIELDYVYDWYQRIGFEEIVHPKQQFNLPVMILD